MVEIVGTGSGFIGVFDQPPPLRKSSSPLRHREELLMIQSGLRRAVAASAAQAGDDDWIISSIPGYRQAGLWSQITNVHNSSDR